MVSPDEMLGWKDLTLIGVVALSSLIAYAVNTFTKRLDEHEKEDKETFNRIFTSQENISEKISVGFRGLDRTVNDIHIKLLERINDVQQSKEL